ncbi:Alpha/beta-Hydrolase [Pleurostoma richardsiae]|uniref:Alpha/beta-Hydrolase n=1 Tax=Pleurostoma richardsiae TaxID=41990 RepID=A0AA38VN61_9PEZI|nr:Alpha/beta-Hydrolase [Pleurostoma richardsiae]
MASAVFDIYEHVVEGQHIREYPRATASSQNDVLFLHVKQYVPKENRNRHARPDDVTIIAAHANGFPKELYEAMWEDLYCASKRHNFWIRGIWIADVAWQGQSGILNEDELGNDPSWYDHSRDLLHMINHFRREMPRPLVGVGHSFGGNILVNLALFHPRVFTTLVLLDPVIFPSVMRPAPLTPESPAHQSTFRRDFWPSRETAVDAFTKNKFFQSWDARVLAAWMAFGIRNVPTKLHPDQTEGFTLSTTKHQEVFTFQRPLYQVDPHSSRVYVERSKLPDLDPATPAELDPAMAPSYRPEGPLTFSRLRHLRPSVLYVFGGRSDISGPEQRRQKMDTTGTGVGGSGGTACGRVKEVVLEAAGHLVAMEAPGTCADHAATWIGRELVNWREEEEEHNAWCRKELLDKQTLDAVWVEHVRAQKFNGANKSKSRI